jgi:hypothetical protein
MRSLNSPKNAHPTDTARPGRPAADEIAALLEPIARQRIPGATDARIAKWRAADRGLSTETFLFDLHQDRLDGPTTLKQLVFRRPPAISLFPDYNLTRQVMVMNRLRHTPIAVPTVCWLDRDGNDLGTSYYVMEQLPTIGTAGAQRGTPHRRLRPGRVLRRPHPAAAVLAAQGFRRAAVDRVMGLDHRPQRAAAPSAVATGPAGLHDLLGGLRAVRHYLVDDVAGGSGAQADEHRGQTRSPMLIRCANLPTN